MIGLLGPNDAGKTTLMQMIATVTRPSSGRILFRGTDIAKSPNELRRQLGYLERDSETRCAVERASADRVRGGRDCHLDVATRDSRAGTTAILYGAPGLRERAVWWKFGSALLLGTLLLLAPLLRTAFSGFAALATALGVITQNPKTFIVIFLSFWYVVVNDKGASPMFDLAGFYRAGTATTTALYAALAAVSLIAASVAHQQRLQRS